MPTFWVLLFQQHWYCAVRPEVLKEAGFLALLNEKFEVFDKEEDFSLRDISPRSSPAPKTIGLVLLLLLVLGVPHGGLVLHVHVEPRCDGLG